MPISSQSTLVDLVLQAGVMVKVVLILLLAFSVFSWAVIFFKYRQFRQVERASLRFLEQYARAPRIRDVFNLAKQNAQTPLAILVQESLSRNMKSGLLGNPGHSTTERDPFANKGSHQEEEADALPGTPRDAQEVVSGVERVLRHTIQDELSYYEGYLGFLATTGNVTPFIGLFGTVWGILNAFHQIGIQGTANIAAVAPGIAEALVATAAGLAAAIPAVIGYNYFVNRMRRLSSQLGVFSGEFLSRVDQEISSPRGESQGRTIKTDRR